MGILGHDEEERTPFENKEWNRARAADEDDRKKAVGGVPDVVDRQ